MAVVALRRTSVTVMSSPEERVPEGPSHWAEGMLVRPVMTSRTVQVRVSSPLPASTGSSIEASVITSRAPGGTGGGAACNCTAVGQCCFIGTYQLLVSPLSQCTLHPPQSQLYTCTAVLEGHLILKKYLNPELLGL